MSVPVGRLAPSPTGLLHLGHARSFLLAWWHMRKRGGRIVMRIEDLDGPRARPEMIEAALRDLRWLGLDWDGEPLLQSSGIDRIMDALHELDRNGFRLPVRMFAQRRPERPERSAARRRSSRGTPGTCRGRFASAELAARSSGATRGHAFQSRRRCRSNFTTASRVA